MGRPRLGGLWLLVPLACCGGPLLIAALAAAGALAWGVLGLGAGVLAAVTALVIRRRHRSGRACRKPGKAGWAPGCPDGGYPAATSAINTTNATPPRWQGGGVRPRRPTRMSAGGEERPVAPH